MKRNDDLQPGVGGAVAYAAPILLFVCCGSLTSVQALRSHYPLLYTVQVIASGAAWCWFRRSYPSPSTRGFAVAIAFGVIGAVGWIGLCRLGLESAFWDSMPGRWPGGGRVAYDPFREIGDPIYRYTFLAIRMVGLVAVVPLIEEMFWRGFLARFLVSDRFESVPIGRFTPFSFGIVTAVFALVHPEFVAALAWGAGINVLLMHTRNIWACVMAHAVTNLLLGLYVIYSGEWSLW